MNDIKSSRSSRLKLEKFVCSLNALMGSRETYDTLSRCNCVYLPSALKMLGRRTNFMVVAVVLNFPILLPEHRVWSVSSQWASPLNQRDASHRDAISDRVWQSSACLTIPNSVRREIVRRKLCRFPREVAPTDAECFAKDRILSTGPSYATTSRARVEIVPYSTVDFVVARLVARAKESLKSATSHLSLKLFKVTRQAVRAWLQVRRSCACYQQKLITCDYLIPLWQTMRDFARKSVQSCELLVPSNIPCVPLF